jgi:O-antigen/teichoic acid export membrane protein
LGEVFSGNFLASVIAFVGSILQARLIAPSDLGIIRLVAIPLGYMAWLHLGVYDGIIRELPYWVGKRETVRAHKYASVAQGWNLFVGCAAASVFAFLAIRSILRGEYAMAAAWATQVLTAVNTFYGDLYLAATYRMGVDFARLAWFRTAQAFASLVLVLLIPLLHFYGVCLRSALGTALGLGLMHHYRPLRVRPTWSTTDFLHLVRVGLPSSFVGYLFSALWVTVEATLVFTNFGSHGLGLYSIAQAAITAMTILPEAMCYYYWPRMSEQYGRTENLADAVQMTYAPVLLMLLASLPAVLVVWVLCGPMVTLALPGYVGAIPLLKWGSLVAASRFLAPPLFSLFVVKKQHFYGIAGASGFAAYYAVIHWAMPNGAAIEIFPQAMVVGRVTMAVVGYAILWRLVRTEQTIAVAASE